MVEGGCDQVSGEVFEEEKALRAKRTTLKKDIDYCLALFTEYKLSNEQSGEFKMDEELASEIDVLCCVQELDEIEGEEVFINDMKGKLPALVEGGVRERVFESIYNN